MYLHGALGGSDALHGGLNFLGLFLDGSRRGFLGALKVLDCRKRVLKYINDVYKERTARLVRGNVELGLLEVLDGSGEALSIRLDIRKASLKKGKG